MPKLSIYAAGPTKMLLGRGLDGTGSLDRFPVQHGQAVKECT